MIARGVPANEARYGAPAAPRYGSAGAATKCPTPPVISAIREVPLDDKQALVDDVFRAGGAALRPDERPDVRRAAPRLEGRSRHGARSAQGRDAVPSPRRGRRHRRCRVPRGRGGRVRHARDGRSTSMPRCSSVGRERAFERGLDDAVSFVEANAEALPFPDRSHDAYSIAFGIRNVPRIERGARRGLSGAQARRPLRCAWNSPPSTCRASMRSITSIRST